MRTELVDRQRRLRNLNRAVGNGLGEEVKRNKPALMRKLCHTFNMEITMAERCVYHDDFDRALYHGFVANMIHTKLKQLEVVQLVGNLLQ